MLPLLLPLLGAAVGGGLGALTSKKGHRLQGGLMGAGLGALGGGLGSALGGATLGSMGYGASSLGAGATGSALLDSTAPLLSTSGLGGAGVSAAHSANMAAGLFNPATASRWGQGLGALSKYGKLAGSMMHPQQQQAPPQSLPPMFDQAMPIPMESMNPTMGRPFAPPVQMAFNQPGYGGYYG